MSRIHDAVLAFIVLFAEVGSHGSEGGIEPLPRVKLLWRVGVAWQRWVDPHACVAFIAVSCSYIISMSGHGPQARSHLLARMLP